VQAQSLCQLVEADPAAAWADMPSRRILAAWAAQDRKMERTAEPI